MAIDHVDQKTPPARPAGISQQRMAAAGGIVVGQGEIEPAIGVEVDELHAVRRVMLQDHVG